MQIEGCTCIVTGGASGLGRGTVAELLARGANVAIFARRQPPPEKIEPGAMFVLADITDDDAVARGVQRVVDTYGALHACVNVAAIAGGQRMVDETGLFPLDVFRNFININLTGTFIVLRRAIEQMLKNPSDGPDGERGVIVNTSSIGAQDASSNAAYSASKGGVESMALTLARNLGPHGIRINTIAPGLMQTEMLGDMTPEWNEQLLRKTVFPNRLGLPAEFGQLACHIIENRFMNATVIRLDAGTRA